MLWPIGQNQLILTMELGDYHLYANVIRSIRFPK